MKWLEYRGKRYLNCTGSMPYLAMPRPIIRLVMPRALAQAATGVRGLSMQEVSSWHDRHFGRWTSGVTTLLGEILHVWRRSWRGSKIRTLPFCSK